MKNNNRTQNSVRNISFGIVITILNTLISFITRTVLIKTLGIEILGLNGLFTEVIAMLSLVELGVGMAIVYNLYRPISENDQKRISQLMGVYREAYSIIAIVTFIIGIVLAFIIDRIVKDVSYPTNYIRSIFLLFVVKTSLSYIFSYKTALLNADQKQYIVSLISVIVKLSFTIVSLVELILFRNYIAYLIILIVQVVSTNIILAKYVDKHYPFINHRDRIDAKGKKDIIQNVRDLFIKRVSGVITSSTDNILISTLVGTIQVGYYNNYTVLFGIVRVLTKQFTDGMAASIGNLFVTESDDQCIIVLRRLTYLYFVFGMIVSSGLMGVSEDFIVMWIGNEYVMPVSIVYVAVYCLFLEICCEPLWQFLEVSGLFKQDKYIGIVGSSVNLVVSIVLGKKMGIVGILVGTVCTQMIQMALKTFLLFKTRFQKKAIEYIFVWIRIHIGYMIVVLVNYYIGEKVFVKSIFVDFAVKGIVSVAIGLIGSFALFYRGQEYTYARGIVMEFYNKAISDNH